MRLYSNIYIYFFPTFSQCSGCEEKMSMLWVMSLYCEDCCAFLWDFAFAYCCLFISFYYSLWGCEERVVCCEEILVCWENIVRLKSLLYFAYIFRFIYFFSREKSLWGHYVLYEVWHEVSGMYVLSSFHMLMSLCLWCYCNVFIVKCAVRLYCICLYLWGYEVMESVMVVGMKVMSVMLIWSFVIVFSFFKLSYF